MVEARSFEKNTVRFALMVLNILVFNCYFCQYMSILLSLHVHTTSVVNILYCYTWKTYLQEMTSDFFRSVCSWHLRQLTGNTNHWMNCTIRSWNPRNLSFRHVLFHEKTHFLILTGSAFHQILGMHRYHNFISNTDSDTLFSVSADTEYGSDTGDTEYRSDIFWSQYFKIFCCVFSNF